MLWTSAFSKDKSDISLEQFNVFITATWKLRVNYLLWQWESDSCIHRRTNKHNHLLFSVQRTLEEFVNECSEKAKLKTELREANLASAGNFAFCPGIIHFFLLGVHVKRREFQYVCVKFCLLSIISLWMGVLQWNTHTHTHTHTQTQTQTH